MRIGIKLEIKFYSMLWYWTQTETRYRISPVVLFFWVFVLNYYQNFDLFFGKIAF